MSATWPNDSFELVASEGGLRVRRLVEGPLVVLALEGTLASGEAGEAFRGLLREAHARSETRAIAVDLRWVHYLPSKTVPWLVEAAGRLEKRGGRVVVVATGPNMERMLEVFGSPEAFGIVQEPDLALTLLADAIEG